MISRMLAIVPSLFVVAWYGDKGTGALLLFSQVILSAQLSFAAIPLIQFTSDRAKMGEFVNGPVVKCIGWGGWRWSSRGSTLI
jgi:manganese transport protein